MSCQKCKKKPNDPRIFKKSKLCRDCLNKRSGRYCYYCGEKNIFKLLFNGRNLLLCFLYDDYINYVDIRACKRCVSKGILNKPYLQHNLIYNPELKKICDYINSR